MTSTPGRDRDPSGAGVVGIVIHYGDPVLTARAIRSISEGDTTPKSVVIVDNGPGALSVPETSNAAEAVPVRVVRPGSNLGFAGGVHLAMQQPECSAADAVWLLNNDAVAERGALSALLREHMDQQGRALVSSRIVKPDGKVWFDQARFFPWLGVARHLRGDRSDGSARRVAKGPAPSWLSAPYLPACSLIVPTALTTTVGGFDPTYFMYGEDIDLSIRAARAGWKLAVAGDSIVVHDASSGTTSRDRERMQAATSLRITARYFRPLVPVALVGSSCVGVIRGIKARSLHLVAARILGLSDAISGLIGRSTP